MATKKSTGKPGLKKAATIARPNQMGVVAAGVLALVETKVSADYLAAFPDAGTSRVVTYDVSTPSSPKRLGELPIYAPWWIAAAPAAPVVYVAAVRKTEGAAGQPSMDIHVVDLAGPRLVTTIAVDASFSADSRKPILVCGGDHLFFSSRTDAKLHVFDISAPLAPTKVAEVTLPATPQEGFADADGALITQLAGPVVEVRGPNWSVTELALRGYSRVVRLRGRLYAPFGDHLNHLAWFSPDGARIDDVKLGPTSTSLHTDGETLVTTGDALSVWTIGDDGAPTLLGKKKDADGDAPRITVAPGLVCVPERPDAKAADKAKAFAFSLWST